MKQIQTIILFILTITSQAQTFDEFIQKGEQFYNESQHLKSGQEYAKAFQMEEGSADQYYNAACSWALSGDTIQSIEYLNLSAEQGWHNLKHIKKDADLNGLRNTLAWQGVLDKVQANLDEYEKDFDKELKKKLERIYVRDQTLRQLYEEAEEKFGMGTDEMNYFWQLINEQDSKNEIEVLAIIDEHGWVGKSLVGGQANMTLWLVIQHAGLEIQEKYLPLLQESAKKGESSGSDLALLEDRIQMRNDLPQTYGSQIIMDNETGEQIVYEIKDPEYVNQRRAEVDLGPIEDYLKRWGIEWTVEQK